jgi:hypothetical protein
MLPFACDNLPPQLTEPLKLHACNDNNNHPVHRIPTENDKSTIKNIVITNNKATVTNLAALSCKTGNIKRNLMAKK